ncbi:M48 family metalloprotease [Actinomadura vinacea]|uniref:M48 family metalloprotease n=1 Tax=Actinomadura vinacea TaxID=115336 RepID=UPI0031D163C2
MPVPQIAGPSHRPSPAASKPLRTAGTTLIVVLLVLVSEGAVVAPIAYGLHLRWPVWGAALPLAIWVALAFLLSVSRFGSASRPCREPNSAERARLELPWQRLTQRSRRLLVTDQDDLNACCSTGQRVVVTAHSARSLPAGQLEAVLAHELGHRSAVQNFAGTHLSWPSRLLWWTLRTLWTPVGPMWKRAVKWHRPVGFLLVFLLATTATAVTAVSALPAGLARALRLVMRPLSEYTEFQADTYAVRLGLGSELLAAVEHQIETVTSGDNLPLPLVRRAERLRRHLAGP